MNFPLYHDCSAMGLSPVAMHLRWAAWTQEAGGKLFDPVSPLVPRTVARYRRAADTAARRERSRADGRGRDVAAARHPHCPEAADQLRRALWNDTGVHHPDHAGAA